MRLLNYLMVKLEGSKEWVKYVVLKAQYTNILRQKYAKDKNKTKIED